MLEPLWIYIWIFITCQHLAHLRAKSFQVCYLLCEAVSGEVVTFFH